MRPGEPAAKIQSDFAYLPDVSVTCSTIDFVVRVKPSFYGLGAGAEELKIGSKCKSNGVLRPDGDLLFTYPLTSCDAVRESSCGYLLYKFVLHYEPSPKRLPRKAHRINVDIECRYQRDHHVYQLAVQPTWETAVVRKRLKGNPSDFQITLMDDLWSRPVKYQVYQIGRTINFQVSAPHVSTGGKLYINTCYATPSSGSTSSLKYAIIDNFGCMSDSKSNPGGSQFISRTDKSLRFSLKAFQFTLDPATVVTIHCKLFVVSEDLGPTHKSCTYRGNGWKALTGDNSLCDCCDSQCVMSKPRRALMEGSASSGSLLVSDQPYTEDGFPPVSRESEATINHYNELKIHENLWDLVKHDDKEQDLADDEEQDYADEEQEYADEEQDYADNQEDNEYIFGVMTEPDLDKSGFREMVFVEEKTESEENGSEYAAQESEEDEMNLDRRKEAEMLQGEQMFPSDGLQRELQMLVSEGEGENTKHAGSGEEDDWLMASEVKWNDDDDLADLDDSEMTWYFTWR
ncbi:zona pellucida sperm-binding protein 3 [Cyclopterus lumpus]|uniref:zona pellucida sperm-binding protein 3 n=1 Tax=Cyclopterus lumpus TaxID=8103 RepID=UPI001485EE8A|nr:zona pellucida sperm-binding protein 3 [Cyclopterus lumpus]